MYSTLRVWKRPRITTKTALIDFETSVPMCEDRPKGGTRAVPPFRVSLQDSGRRFIRLNEGGFTVRLTTKELEQMKSVDIGAVSPESLPDVSGMTFNNALSREDRVLRFLQVVKNPYCFCVGGVGVKIEFAESGPSLQDALTDFLLRQKSGL